VVLVCLIGTAAAQTGGQTPAPGPGITQQASDGCTAKVKKMEEFASDANRKEKHQSTRFTEAEINSYLAFELSKYYHPSLKSLVMRFEDPKLQGVATINFDELAMTSKKVLTKLVARLFSGVHTLTVRGELRTSAGKGQFVLDEALFDGNALPNFLVEEIITSVGRKQKPPFDPLQPSQMPYAIDRVEVHTGYIIVHQ
jgi:hypothetical protein